MWSIYYWEKLTFSKHVRKVNFPERKFEDSSFEEQKGTGIFGETFILTLLSSAVLRLQNRVSGFF